MIIALSKLALMVKMIQRFINTIYVKRVCIGKRGEIKGIFIEWIIKIKAPLLIFKINAYSVKFSGN